MAAPLRTSAPSTRDRPRTPPAARRNTGERAPAGPPRANRCAITFPEIGSLDALAALVGGRPGEMFLRWSRGPEADADAGGRSVDHESGLVMAGLSVTALDPPSWWTRPPADWLARQIHKYAQLGAEPDRFGWVLTGREVGRGVDHEPLLTDVTPVGRLGDALVDEAARVYARRFDAGRDSRGS